MEELKASSGFFGSIKIDLKDSKIFQIGFGGIGNNMLDLYLKHFTFKSGHIVICDKNPDILPLDTRFWDSGARAPETHNGIIFKNIHVTQENYKQVYREHLKQGDLLLDLGYYVDTLDSLIWCKENGVKFVNAAVEEWETNESNDLQYPQNEVRTYTLYHRQMKIQEITKKWGNSPTAILTHGANPGWCSSVTKIGMKHWVEYLKKNMGEQFTCKDLRTYSANVLFVEYFLKNVNNNLSDKNSKNKIILESIKQSAEKLGHSKGICKKSYISESLVNYCLESFESAKLESKDSLLNKLTGFFD
jgi:homospermidine synthase